APEHPYLQALLRAVPRFGMKTGERLVPIREIKSAGQASFLANKDPWPADVADDAVLLEVKHLTKRFSIKKSGFLFKQPSSS
ncbi:hypothetical protein ACP3W1_26910, partial [Salmonella enterica]